MRHCLDLTHQCPVSPTAFCVGSTLFLPSTSTLYHALQPHFPSFSTETGTSPAGLILDNGYSRQIPGNTHAEANALTNFRARYAELAKAKELPGVEEVLREADCYATMEPCSVRTSGGPSCALELVRSKVRTVYLVSLCFPRIPVEGPKLTIQGVEEPADFVQCEGVQILQDGGVTVRRTIGLEEECLKAARRGRI
jgi:pyrimidine deaminase RibD-like protein